MFSANHLKNEVLKPRLSTIPKSSHIHEALRKERTWSSLEMVQRPTSFLILRSVSGEISLFPCLGIRKCFPSGVDQISWFAPCLTKKQPTEESSSIRSRYFMKQNLKVLLLIIQHCKGSKNVPYIQIFFTKIFEERYNL